MGDTEHLTNSNDTDQILTPDMVDGMLEGAKDVELDGFDEYEFAAMVADIVGAFLPPDADVIAFKQKYLAISVPALKFGGFKKLTAGMTLGSLVESSPWIGWLVCGGGLIAALYIAYPKPTPEELEQRQIEAERKARQQMIKQGQNPFFDVNQQEE